MKTPGRSKEKHETLLQEQQELQESAPLPAPIAESEQSVESGTAADTSVTPRKKRVKRLVSEAELMPRPSLWPVALAAALALTLFGFIWNTILLGIGVLLVIVCIAGWMLERR